MSEYLGLHTQDNFIPSFEALKDSAHSLKFKDVTIGDGKTYRGIAPFDHQDAWDAIHTATGGRTILPVVSFFRRYEKEMPQDTFIHSDIGFANKIAILPMDDEPSNGGTAFWMHKQTKFVKPSPTSDLKHFVSQTKQEDKWSLLHVEQDKKNRLLMFDAELFHSRMPQFWRWDEPRLIAVFFFNFEAK